MHVASDNDMAVPLLRILYVEDNDDLRGAMSHLLGGNGREVIPVANAEDALAAFETSQFDVVVTDISLPGMSGTDLTRAILRAQPLHWVVLCSAYDSTDWASQLGRNVRSLIKPFEPEAMEALMAEIAGALE
jgi:two-component system, cell cycle response regulator CpdR